MALPEPDSFAPASGRIMIQTQIELFNTIGHRQRNAISRFGSAASCVYPIPPTQMSRSMLRRVSTFALGLKQPL
jgi:hypothetical protein